MAVRQGSTTAVEQTPDAGVGPRVAYLVDSGGGVYVWYVGQKNTEADAYLEDSGSGIYVLHDTAANEDRVSYLVDTSKVIV